MLPKIGSGHSFSVYGCDKGQILLVQAKLSTFSSHWLPTFDRLFVCLFFRIGNFLFSDCMKRVEEDDLGWVHIFSRKEKSSLCETDELLIKCK